MVFGEITTSAVLDYNQIVRDTVKWIGFDDSAKGNFSARIMNYYKRHSHESFFSQVSTIIPATSSLPSTNKAPILPKVFTSVVLMRILVLVIK